MRKVAGLLVLLWLAEPAPLWAQANTFTSFVQSAPIATVPPANADRLALIQNGLTRQLNAATTYMFPTASNATLPTARTNLGASVSGGIWPSSLGGTGVNNTGTITLGGSLITTGTGPTTLAFPAGASTMTFPSASKTLMASDYTNGVSLGATNALLTSNGVAIPNAVVITGLVKGNGASAPAAYGGTSCTNQLIRAIDLNGAATCATVGSADLAASLLLVTPNIGAATGVSLSVSGQLTSTVATGTAPLVVSSTTNVANLDASTLVGNTWDSPGDIGNGTPGEAVFSFITSNGDVSLQDTSAAGKYVNLRATSSTALTAGRLLTLDMKNVAHTLAFGSTANTITFPSVASYTVAGLSVSQTFTANQTFGALAILNGYTVAGLPAGTIGAIAYVTDATVCSIGTVETGGGTVFCLVAYTGAAWHGIGG